MSELRRMNQRELEILLGKVKVARCSVSLRLAGSARMLGQLQVRGLESWVAIQLGGIKQRELLPPAGTRVMLSLLLDEEVVSMDTVLLEPLADGGGRQRLRVLRAAWPVDQLEFHHRDDVRVATPDLPPLGASLILEGQRYPAKLLNLTETGMGLGLHQGLPFQPRGEVMVETLLPGGSALQLVGEVRHWERLEDDPLPVRLGLVLKHLPDEVREQLRRMIQARRIIRSEAIRGE